MIEYDSGASLCEDESALQKCQLVFLDINMEDNHKLYLERPNGLVFLIVEAVIQNAVPTVRDSPTRYTGKYTVLRFREIPKT